MNQIFKDILSQSPLTAATMKADNKEIKTEIQNIENEMIALESRVDSLTNHGRSASKKDRFEQLRLLNEWRDYNNQLTVLREVLDKNQN